MTTIDHTSTPKTSTARMAIPEPPARQAAAAPAARPTRRRQRVRKAVLLFSFLLFPLTLNFLSPYLSLAGAIAGAVSGSLLLFGGLLVSSLFLGRAFCGWVCPGGAAQELCGAVSDRKVRPRRLDWIKYAIWVPWAGTIGLMLARAALTGRQGAGDGIRVEPLFMMSSWISVDAPGRFVLYYGILALIMGTALLVGRRAMCHSVCWVAPFMVLGRRLRNLLRWPSLRLEADPYRCTRCRRCTGACAMSLPVHELVARGTPEHPECILCGRCVDTCPNQVIRYRFAPGL